MSNLTKSFRDSFHELKDVKALATTAMLLAIAVVLGFYTLQVDIYKDHYQSIRQCDSLNAKWFLVQNHSVDHTTQCSADGSRSGYREISGTSDGSIFPYTTLFRSHLRCTFRIPLLHITENTCYE